MLRRRRKLVTKHIYEVEQEKYARKLTSTIENLRKNGGGMKEETFWEFKRKLERKKNEGPNAMKNEKGERVEGKEEILKLYESFYKKLFKTKEARTSEEQDQENRINKKLNNIIQESKNQMPMMVGEEKIEKVVKELKRKKASDIDGWNNEMILEGGIEMTKSLTSMVNKVNVEGQIPEQWELMKIKSIYKNKGSRQEMKNRRGIFLTSILSKVYEKVLMGDIQLKESIYQNGGKKCRSTKDNWLAMNAVIDKNKRLNNSTYLVFADAEKCFDKLWLEDCLVDMNEAGMREKEVQMILELNKRARIVIETPVGLTEEFKERMIVKQGTIFGPKLCCSSTSKVNDKSNMVAMISPTMKVESLIYVDDINATGSKMMIETAVDNLKEMEMKKKFTFNLEKTNFMIIENRRQTSERPTLILERGEMSEVKEYKYLGNWITTTGTVERQLDEIEKRVKGMMYEMMKMASRCNLGKFSTEGRLILYERTIVPVITFNLEVWTSLRKKDWERLEKIQAMILKKIMSLPQSTPYWGLLGELGIWPIQDKVNYHRLMLFENIINSDEERLAKKIIENQRETQIEQCWYSETIKICKLYEIEYENVDKVTKMQWKKIVKERITNHIKEVWNKKKEDMRKLRHQSGTEFGKKEYLLEINIDDASEIMRSRLELWDIGNNHGKKRKCVCEEEETSEHITSCQEVKKIMLSQMDGLWVKEEKMGWKLKEYTNWIKEYLKLRDGM